MVAGASIAGECEPEWVPTFGNSFNDQVYDMVVFDDGAGPALYACGLFTQIDGVTVNRIARWDGENWTPMGTGFASIVETLAVFDDGTGPSLYVGGWFNTTSWPFAAAGNHIVRWDGEAWQPVGGGVSSVVHAMKSFDDGTGPALYVGGNFTNIGGGPGNGIAKWDGNAWSQLGSGTSHRVFALEVFDDGNGPALYVGGQFPSAGDVAGTLRIARWDGATWSSLGTGMNNRVNALATFDDGSGEALYAGGSFTTASGQTVNYIARWDGAEWSALNGGVNNVVHALTVFDDGSGPALYVGGEFTSAGGVEGTERIAKWNGTEWSPIGGGTPDSFVRQITEFDDGSGTALFISGHFQNSPGGDAFIAKWRPCLDEPSCPADLTGDNNVGVPDLLALLGCWGNVQPGTECEAADITASGVVGVPDLLELLSQWGPCP